jgi:hypothetical protein
VIVPGGFTYALFKRYPHKKQSKADKSGDVAGHRKFPFLEEGLEGSSSVMKTTDQFYIIHNFKK